MHKKVWLTAVGQMIVSLTLAAAALTALPTVAVATTMFLLSRSRVLRATHVRDGPRAGWLGFLPTQTPPDNSEDGYHIHVA